MDEASQMWFTLHQDVHWWYVWDWLNNLSQILDANQSILLS